MFIKQYLDPGPACASYMIGCHSTGQAVVIDPLDAVGAKEYARQAEDLGVKITHIFDTHVHADHISAGRALSELTGAPLLMHESAPVSYAFTPVKDGERIQVGNVRIEARHTPGHTPESMSLVVSDLTRSEEPWMVFTGDTLFVGDVGRPDLLLGEPGEETTEQRAERLFISIRDQLLTLPETVELYPGHYGGSTCGGQHMSAKPISTIGFERRHNRPLQAADARAFAESVIGTLRPQPPRYRDIKRVNLGRLASLPPEDNIPSLSVAELNERLERGEPIAVLDVREPIEWAGGTIPGAQRISLGRLEGALGRLDPQREMAVICATGARSAAAAAFLRSKGFPRVHNVNGGMYAWQGNGYPVERG